MSNYDTFYEDAISDLESELSGDELEEMAHELARRQMFGTNTQCKNDMEDH